MSFFNWAWDWITTSANWTHGSPSIPQAVLAHLGYSVLPWLIAALIGIPAGVVIGHRGGNSAVAVINFANACRAIPTLGLLVLLAVFLGFSPLTWLLPLVVLAIPSILVNTYEGILGVDPAAKDAAAGMGMSGFQSLLQVEAPAALPLIVLGLRTAAIQVVSTATIAAYIGLGGLGRFIIDGLADNNYAVVAGGGMIVVLLALAVQLVFTIAGRLIVPAGLRKAAH